MHKSRIFFQEKNIVELLYRCLFFFQQYVGNSAEGFGLGCACNIIIPI